jgi:hypothetical protein
MYSSRSYGLYFSGLEEGVKPVLLRHAFVVNAGGPEQRVDII